MDDFIGKRFGRLMVICEVPRERYVSGKRRGRLKNIEYVCLCDCGNTCNTSKGNLKKENTTSCGCLKSEMLSARNTTHGITSDPLYSIWQGIKRRTTNPKDKFFADYGGRGITLHPDWLNDFQAFYDYVKGHLGEKPTPHHSLDRSDNDGPYASGNIQWSSPEEQANNTRANRVITFQGITTTLTLHCRRLGLDYWAVKARLNACGWSVDKALSEPLRSKPRRSLTFQGITDTLANQCRRVGLGANIAIYRLNHGWSVVEALSIPLGASLSEYRARFSTEPLAV